MSGVRLALRVADLEACVEFQSTLFDAIPTTLASALRSGKYVHLDADDSRERVEQQIAGVDDAESRGVRRR